MTNYILIHGSFGSPFVNWFPYLRKVSLVIVNAALIFLIVAFNLSN